MIVILFLLVKEKATSLNGRLAARLWRGLQKAGDNVPSAVKHLRTGGRISLPQADKNTSLTDGLGQVTQATQKAELQAIGIIETTSQVK